MTTVYYERVSILLDLPLCMAKNMKVKTIPLLSFQLYKKWVAKCNQDNNFGGSKYNCSISTELT